MNKIRNLAWIAWKKWTSLNDWNKIHISDCSFCDDASETCAKKYDGFSELISCGYCVAPKILCDSGYHSLYQSTMNIYEASDDFNPKKTIRLMRVGILFLILFGKLPKWFMKHVKKYILKLNKEHNEIDF